MKLMIIGVSGGSGSGKSRFLQLLKKSLNDKPVTFISQDDYYHARDLQEKDENGVINFDLPSSVNHKQLIDDIRALSKGQSVHKKEYTFNNSLKTAKEFILKPNPVIIVEGLFVYHFPELRKLYDVKLFIDAPDNVKLIRRIKRDQNERNYPIEDVLYRYEHHVMPAFEQFIKPYLSQADMIINNHDDCLNAVDMLSAYIATKW